MYRANACARPTNIMAIWHTLVQKRIKSAPWLSFSAVSGTLYTIRLSCLLCFSLSVHLPKLQLVFFEQELCFCQPFLSESLQCEEGTGNLGGELIASLKLMVGVSCHAAALFSLKSVLRPELGGEVMIIGGFSIENGLTVVMSCAAADSRSEASSFQKAR